MQRQDDIEALVFEAVFSSDDTLKNTARQKIREITKKNGILPASINSLYMAVGKGKTTGFTVPAINIRAMTYDTAKVIFNIALSNNIGAFIFEIARSEQKYTEQKPDEYTVCILAAAVATGWKGPVFIQGDHYQFKASSYKTNPQEEIEKIKSLIKDSISAGFYNIDIDASTLVDLSKVNLDEQQRENYLMTAMMTKYIRQIEPKGITVSVGGEIGHIGGKNSTVYEFEAFMKGFAAQIAGLGKNIVGLSKVSVQTGTSHGGIPLADGTIAKVNLDFDVLESIGKTAREKYWIGGAVQHGASTLPEDLFDRFPETKTLEVHLATGFQNTVFDTMPVNLRDEIYNWLKENCKDERKEGQTDEQFIYTTRKKACGPFKEKLWRLSKKDKQPIVEGLQKQFQGLFNKLKVVNTKKITEKYIYG